MLLSKFNYQPLTRNTDTETGSRLYLTPDGEKLPSVTTILSATMPKEKANGLREWRKSVGEKRAQEITTEAASRGTRMHKYLEGYVLTGALSPPGSNPYSIQSNRMAEKIIKHGLSNCSEFWGSEIPLYFPKIYAGTTDLAGVHDGHEAILDFKQTNKPKKREHIEDYFLQLVFYGTAHNEVYNTNIKKGVILMCSAAEEYQEFILDGDEWNKTETLMWKRLEQFYSM